MFLFDIKSRTRSFDIKPLVKNNPHKHTQHKNKIVLCEKEKNIIVLKDRLSCLENAKCRLPPTTKNKQLLKKA
jgi:hypothetical protein